MADTNPHRPEWQLFGKIGCAELPSYPHSRAQSYRVHQSLVAAITAGMDFLPIGSAAQPTNASASGVISSFSNI